MAVFATDSTALFIQQARRLVSASHCSAASIDVDHAGFFLKRYGCVRVEEVLTEAWRCLDAKLSTYDAVILHSSLDETEALVAGIKADELIRVLDGVASETRIIASRLFQADIERFGFTAVVAESMVCSSADVDGRLRTTAMRSQIELRHVKERLGRGRVYRTQKDSGALETSPLSRRIWDELATRRPGEPRSLMDGFEDFEVMLRTHRPKLLALLTPRYGGTLFDAPEATDGGGRTTLVDGTPVGKLGFLNRVFGEHLTPNLITEAALSQLLSGLFAAESTTVARTGSSLLLAFDRTVQDPESLMVEAWESARRDLNRVISPEIELSWLQAALLAPDAAGVALDLAHRVYKLPAPVQRSGWVDLHDCRDLPLDAFRALAADYEVRAQDALKTPIA